MSHLPHTTQADMDTIDRYLASDLDAAERIRFDERLSNEPSLASELARQRLLSEALRRVVPQPRTGLAIDILARAVATRGLERTSAPSQPWLAKPLPLIGASLATIALVAGTLVWTGVKDTGNGRREAGQAALDAFSEWKAVYVDYSGRLQKAQIDTAPALAPKADA